MRKWHKRKRLFLSDVIKYAKKENDQVLLRECEAQEEKSQRSMTQATLRFITFILFIILVIKSDREHPNFIQYFYGAPDIEQYSSFTYYITMSIILINFSFLLSLDAENLLSKMYYGKSLELHPDLREKIRQSTEGSPPDFNELLARIRSEADRRRSQAKE